MIADVDLWEYPLLAGVYKEHAKTEDSMTDQYSITRILSHCMTRSLRVLYLSEEDTNEKTEL
jgi:hypothetical protein